jgi:glycosyltransferase involved in cell wall biosynthesis
MDKPKILWTTPEQTVEGNAFGYTTHNNFMRKHCNELMDFDDNAEVALTITPADHFNPVPNKINILFSMWEFLDLPESYIRGINKADAIVVPSSFCRDIFKRYTNLPIYVCWEGIEPSLYQYHQRKLPLKNGKLDKFRFLWVGAPNPRKGYPLILEAIKVFEKVPNVEIYMKTTVPKINWKETLWNIWRHRKEIFRKEDGRISLMRWLRRIPKPNMHDKITVYGKHKNIIFDTRKLPIDDLVNLYNSAHCFVLPTLGEGWGLTLNEAMATGCPCIATAVTGCADFFNDQVGYPISFDIRDQELRNYDIKTKGYVPDTIDFINKMIHVMTHYDEALKLGARASRHVLGKFTWDKSAQRLCDIVREVYKS